MAKLLPLPAQNVAFVNKEDGTPTPVFYTWLQSLMNCLGQWTTVTGVTISAAAGTITGYTAACRFLQLGKIVFFWLEVDISVNGTGSGRVLVQFPAAMPVPLSDQNAIAGVEFVDDITINGELFSDLTMKVETYNANYPGFDGAQLVFNGTYEAA